MAAQTQGACPHTVDPQSEETLFTFNVLLNAAASVASPAQRAELQRFLLATPRDSVLDRAYPIRHEVAAAVQTWPTELSRAALKFALDHEAAATNYNALVLQALAPAPSFAPLQRAVPGGAAEHHIVEDSADLAALMRRVHQQIAATGLWERSRREFEAAQLCDDHLAELNQAIATYVRLPNAPLRSGSQIISNPLMPMGSGVTCVFADGHIVMLVGPTLKQSEQDLLVTHELTHPLLNELFHHNPALANALHDSACVFPHMIEGDSDGIMTRYVYNTWESYLFESLVRGISHRILGVPERRIAAFAIAPTIQASLATFELTGGTLADAAIHTMHALRNNTCAQNRVATRDGGRQ